MPKLLLIVGLAFLVWLAVRVLGGQRKRDVPPSAAPPAVASEPIRQCAWCGVHVPIGAAIALPDGRLYCSPSHRDAAVAAATDRPRA